VKLTPTPADFHEKRAERYIQTLKERKRAKEVQWNYEIPSKLEAELYLSTIRDMNTTPNKVSSPYTPYQLVKHHKPTTPKYQFGELGLFYSRRKYTPSRGEYGIFISQGDNQNYYRAYISHRNNMFSRRKFVPTPTATIPPEWNLKSKFHHEEHRGRPKKFTPDPTPTIVTPVKHPIVTSTPTNSVVTPISNQNQEANILLKSSELIQLLTNQRTQTSS
jgi:hypothetical protein